jgi:hypothetical protein
VVGEDRSRTALNAREQEVLTFVRNAITPARMEEAEGRAGAVTPSA